MRQISRITQRQQHWQSGNHPSTDCQMFMSSYICKNSESELQRRYFCAIFKVVPIIVYQLLTLFPPYLNLTYHMMYVLMTRKSQDLYQTVFAARTRLVPEFRLPISWPTSKRFGVCLPTSLRQHGNIRVLVSLFPDNTKMCTKTWPFLVLHFPTLEI